MGKIWGKILSSKQCIDILQWLAKKLVVWSIYLIKRVFLAKGFELLKSCQPHDHLAPNIVRLEAFKKALLVHVPQGTAKLQAVKLFSFFKNYIFLLICHIEKVKREVKITRWLLQILHFWLPFEVQNFSLSTTLSSAASLEGLDSARAAGTL